MNPGEAEVHAYYEGDAERDRLDTALGVVEFERTKEIVARRRRRRPRRWPISEVGQVATRSGSRRAATGSSIAIWCRSTSSM